MQESAKDIKFQKQIDKFYQGKLNKYEVFFLGYPSEQLQKVGLKNVPIVMRQSTLKKCIREPRGSRSAHELEKELIKTVPKQIETPIFAVQDKERESIVLILNAQNKDKNNLLIAIKMNAEIQFGQANEVKSIYGKEHLKEYCQKHIENNQLIIVDKTKAETLSRFIGLRLPKTLTSLDYTNIISGNYSKVNISEQKNKMIKEIRNAGFKPTQKLLSNIEKLNRMNGKENTIKEIHKAYRENGSIKPEEQELMNEIAKECRQQEVQRAFQPER